MDKQKPKIDVINMVLEDCILAYPVSSFIISLYQQYQKRGWLTKKQLEGLHAKASKVVFIQGERLAALEAIIKKMPNRLKSDLPIATSVVEKDNFASEMIEAILAKYPQHKRVLFLKSKYDNNEAISAAELKELEKFKAVLKL
jgi:hypothetical protein